MTFFDSVKSLSFQADPDYDFLIGIFVEVMNTYCLDVQYYYDWNNRLKSHTSMELTTNFTYQKANTSLALGNNNISRNSPHTGKDDSHLNQINEELNNMSIFQNNINR
jgi:hypothetical protein